MPLETLYYISQIIAVVLILASLVAIFFQQHQTNAIAKAQITQNANGQYAVLLAEIMRDPDLTAQFRKVMFDDKDLTPVEVSQILMYFNLSVSIHSNAWYLAESKLILDNYLNATENNIAWYLTAPLFAGEWRRSQRRGLFGDEYSAYMNRRFTELYPDHDPATLSVEYGGANDSTDGREL